MALLVINRHGESTYNQENRFTGNSDVELTPLGKEEAHIAGRKLKDFKFDAAYTSTLKRTQESLQIILEEINQAQIPFISVSELNERMYGSLQGMNKSEAAEKYGLAQIEIWRRSFNISPPEGESLKDTYDRVVPYYKLEIEPKLKAGETILIVAHGNSLRALVKYLENINDQEIAEIDIPTGALRVYNFNRKLQIINVEYL